MKKRIPTFHSEEEAALFWENHEVLDYVDSDEFKVVKPNGRGRYSFASVQAKPQKQLISLRIDSSIVMKAKIYAAKKGVGYQTVLRSWLEKAAGLKS